jgi:hypothetical protein
MKCKILIDFDTEREDPTIVGKSQEDINNINDVEFSKKTALDDITAICNALSFVIQSANDSGYIDSNVSAKMCVNYLNDNFLEKK